MEGLYTDLKPLQHLNLTGGVDIKYKVAFCGVPLSSMVGGPGAESVQGAGCAEAPCAQGRRLPCHHGHKGSLSPFGASPGLKSNRSFQVCEKEV